MGFGFEYKCRNCGKEGKTSLDVGKLYPKICAAAKEKAISGCYGDIAAQAVQDNPEGLFDLTRVIYRCSCGYWCDDEKVQYCIPKKPVTVGDCYNEWNGHNAKIVWKKTHYCPKCGKGMKRYRGEMQSLKCPECGGEIEQTGFRMWD